MNVHWTRPVTPRMPMPAEPTVDPAWVLVEGGFVPAREPEVESLFAFGNGYVGSCGSLAEGSAMSTPVTCVAGVYACDPGSVPALARLPDWARISVSVEGRPLRLESGRMLEHRRILDLLQGMLWREWRHQDEDGRITAVRELRFASLADRHLLFQSIQVTAENYSGSLSIDAATDGLTREVTTGGITVALATCSRLNRQGRDATDAPAHDLTLAAEPGDTFRLDRLAAVYTSRDHDEPVDLALHHAGRAAGDVASIVSRHCDAWRERWRLSDITIVGDSDAQRALRFAVYHLCSAANPEDGRVSIGARGLTGSAYSGHVFWDTDIFMLPFFVMTFPEAARALSMYRHHTLPGARAKAAARGCRGALYAWESADSGEEVTPSFVIGGKGEIVRVLTGEQEEHISADVAYGVWTYWRASGDERFLLEAGAEILIETARYWASRATREDDGRYHIGGVIGPDEYHETVDDNAYTNGMAQWNLEAAAEAVQVVAARWPGEWQALSGQLGFAAEEPDRWLAVARELYTGFDEETGLFEQFRGYFALEEIDLAPFAQRTTPMDVVLGRERVSWSKIIKQPDVVMLICLLWERFSPEVRKTNFDYYEPRCGHGSSLSPAIHALVAARLGYAEMAERYFVQAANIDLGNNMGNAGGGVHTAALGGIWQAAAFGFAGLELVRKEPKVRPNLPSRWRQLSMRFSWHSRWHEVTLPQAVAGPAALIHRRDFDAAIFDLDGVLTDTASLHAAAWKQTFDPLLQRRAERLGLAFQPFDVASDYLAYVDGRAREDGIRTFFAARGIDLPEGSEDDDDDVDTVRAIGKRKTRLFLQALARGIEPAPGVRNLLAKLRQAGIAIAVGTSSKNAAAVLQAAGLDHMIDVRVDGLHAEQLGLPGKPDPALFLQTANRVCVEPLRAIVFEDALAGVAAGRNGGFGRVVGVDRGDQPDALRRHGADVVIKSLQEVEVATS
jgi:beta-phosphoglucomutase family hydrolase